MRAKKSSPAMARASLAASKKPGYLMGSAIGAMLATYAKPGDAEKFRAWRVMPETMMFIEALRELALNPAYVVPESDSFEVQFGLTSGLQLAAALLSDPSSVYPQLFTGLTPGAEPLPDASYSVEPDAERR